MDTPHETQDAEIVSTFLCRVVKNCSYKTIGTEMQKSFFTDYNQYLHCYWITVVVPETCLGEGKLKGKLVMLGISWC